MVTDAPEAISVGQKPHQVRRSRGRHRVDELGVVSACPSLEGGGLAVHSREDPFVSPVQTGSAKSQLKAVIEPSASDEPEPSKTYRFAR